MVALNGKDIQVSKGDTLSLQVAFTGDELPEGTKVLFTVRENPADPDALFEKEYEPEGNTISIYLDALETNHAPGVYVWDLRVILPEEEFRLARVITPFVPAKFEVLEVVGNAM